MNYGRMEKKERNYPVEAKKKRTKQKGLRFKQLN